MVSPKHRRDGCDVIIDLQGGYGAAAFERQRPLCPRFRLLYTQEQTFLVVSPKVRS